MALQVTDLEQMVLRRLGGKPRIPIARLADAAGAFLVGAYNWRWAQPPAKLLTVPASADWVALPSDFGQILSVKATGLNSTVKLTTSGAIDQKRAGIVGTGAAITYVALGYRRDSTTGVPRPVLEVWPSASTTRTNLVRMRYRARWIGVQGEAARIPLPEWPELEMAFVDIVCAYAQGNDEHDTAGRSGRLAEIVAGPDFQAAISMDAGAVNTIGPIEHGAVDDYVDETPSPTFWG